MHLNKSSLYITLLSICSFSEATHAMQLEEIDCNQALQEHSVYTVLNKHTNTLDGWNHIDVDSDEFKTLKLDNKDYQIGDGKFTAETECNGIKVQNAILAVKLNDWTRQHANGFETAISTDNINFTRISHVMIDLRINQDKTHIPSVDFLHQRYAKHVEKQLLDTFDNGKVNLAITLFENGALDQSTSSLNAQYLLEVDQQKYFDQWLRILIPINQFDVYQEKEYTRSPDTIANNAETLIGGFRITSETSHGKQLRNLLGDNWNESFPETFKEVSISFRRIEFLQINK